MPNQILQVDENMLETKLDRLVSEKVEQLLNAMLDAEADEITGACRRSYTLECKTLHADERVPVDAPLPERGDTGTDGQEKRADAGRTDARGRR